MPQLHIRAKLLTKPADIKKSILEDFVKHLQFKINTSLLSGLEKKIQNIIKLRLEETDEVLSLKSGVLRAEFGLENSSFKVERIIDALAEKVKVFPIPVRTVGGSKVKGGLRISFDLQQAQNELMSLQEATQRTAKGEDLHWLEWLLKRGNEVIIENYFVIKTRSKRSRTGEALMVKEEGKRWFVPPQFSGTENNNWLTRSLANLDKDIAVAVQEALNRVN